MFINILDLRFFVKPKPRICVTKLIFFFMKSYRETCPGHYDCILTLSSVGGGGGGILPPLRIF